MNNNKIENSPKIVCPKCHHPNEINITVWQTDINRLGALHCVKCNQQIFSTVLFIANTTIPGLIKMTKDVLGSLKKSTKIPTDKKKNTLH